MSASRGHQTSLLAVLLAAGLLGQLALHFVEPRLAMTWSFAHLGRHSWFRWAGAALVLLLPVATALVWRHPIAMRPVGRIGRGRAAGAIVGGGVALVALGLAFPARPICVDAGYFLKAVTDGTSGNPRWYLTLLVFSGLAAHLRPLMDPVTFVRVANSVLVAAALGALAACARLLGRTRGEVAAITLLAWSSFGVLQLAMGYVDIYPVALLATAAYLWTGLRVVAGEGHVLWPALIATIGPFCYVGLILLAPSVPLLAWVTARKPGGWRRVAAAVAAAIAVAGAATLPGFGRPFAWRAYVAGLGGAMDWGERPGWGGSTLPLGYVFSRAHVADLAHGALLTDGVGMLLLAVAGGWALLRRYGDVRFVFLLSVVVPCCAFMALMDPVWGPFGDWDVFSYGAAATSLGGAYAFILWGRVHPRTCALLVGLALATAGVHLLARLDGLHIDLQRHLAESPFHLPVAPPAGPPGPG